MPVTTPEKLAILCVVCVTAACAGCYKPAAGGSATYGSAAALSPASLTSASPPKPIGSSPPEPIGTAPPEPIGTAPPKTDPTPSASPTASKPDTEMSAVVRAALSGPVPGVRPDPRATATGGQGGTGAPVASRSPSRSPSRLPDRTKVLAAPTASNGIAPLTFDDLIFPLEKGQSFDASLLTDKIRGLFDRKVKIRGYIHPLVPFQTGIRSFILVRDDRSCCFGPGAALYDCIMVRMTPGHTVDFTSKPIAVEGTLRFREFKDLDGKHLAIYHLDGDAAE
jgi:hypothetical protein